MSRKIREQKSDEQKSTRDHWRKQVPPCGATI